MYQFKPHEAALWKQHGITEHLKNIETLEQYDALQVVYTDLLDVYGFIDITQLTREVLREAQTRIDVYSRYKKEPV